MSGLGKSGSVVLFVCVATSLAATPAAAQGDARKGERVFQAQCAQCHTPAAGAAHGPKGPKLAGVTGRRAGSIPGWEYSPALRASGLEFHPRHRTFLVWTDENLDKWLADPAVFVPGSRMDLKMPDRADRADVIAYLKTLE